MSWKDWFSTADEKGSFEMKAKTDSHGFVTDVLTRETGQKSERPHGHLANVDKSSGPKAVRTWNGK